MLVRWSCPPRGHFDLRIRPACNVGEAKQIRPKDPFQAKSSKHMNSRRTEHLRDRGTQPMRSTLLLPSTSCPLPYIKTRATIAEESVSKMMPPSTNSSTVSMSKSRLSKSERRSTWPLSGGCRVRRFHNVTLPASFLKREVQYLPIAVQYTGTRRRWGRRKGRTAGAWRWRRETRPAQWPR